MNEKIKKLLMLLAAGTFVAAMPLGSTPHLIQKLQMLANGTLTKVIDIFDLIMHGGMLAFAIWYGINMLFNKVTKTR